MNGGDGDDLITGGEGDDSITAGAGNDTVVFSGDAADYTITGDSVSATVTDNDTVAAGDDGTDTITGARVLRFQDQDVFLNNAPSTDAEAYVTDEDTAIQTPLADLLDGDSDADGDPLTVTTVQNAVNGTVQIIGTDFRFTPDANYNGPASFEYVVSDGFETTTQVVNITVNAVNDAPVAVSDSTTTNEDTAVVISPLVNDTDVENDALTITGVGTASNGTVVNNGDGTVTYTPNADFNGSDSFTYDISDGNGGTDTATVSVTVDPVNDAPDAVNDSATTDENNAVIINLLGNDTDVEGDTLTITALGTPSNGTVVDNGDGTVTYTPNADYDGPDSFTYDISDGNGGTDTATVSVTVNDVAPGNTAPVAADDAEETDEDTPITFNILGNDSDAEEDPIQLNEVRAPDGTVIPFDTATDLAVGGVITISRDGTVVYNPAGDFEALGFNPQPEPPAATFDLVYNVIEDTDAALVSNDATVTIDLRGVNDAPVAADDSDTTNEDTAVIIDLLGNDTDVDGGPLTITGVGTASNGTVVDNGDGTVTYTPDADFNGSDSFTYDISDGNGGTDTATVSVTVDPVNDAPVAADDSDTTNEDTAVIIDLLANDTDVDGDTLTITGVGTASNGTVVDNGDGTVTYTPDADFNGSDSFTYDISDGNGGTDTATVSVTVDPVNDAPDAVDDSATTDEDNAVIINLLGNDTDVEGDTLTISAIGAASNGTVVDNGDGTVTYTPDAEFNGSDSFTYDISDGNGGTDTATVSVTVNAVDPENTAPVAADDSATTNEDNAVIISLLGNDTDVDGDTLTITNVGAASNGTVVDNGDGTVTYTPDADFNGSDSFTYDISDGNGGTDTATVSVTVNPVNDAPVAADDNATTNEDTAVIISVLANDTDVEGDVLTITGVGAASNGTVVDNGDGTVTYTPDADFNGSDSFTYDISDGNGGTDTATVSVTVDPVNDAPVAADDSATTNEDTAVIISVLANDTDVEGDVLTITGVGAASNGTVVDNGDGTVTYTPDADFNGSDSFTYDISDGNGGTDTATVSVTVDPVNDAPVITSPAEFSVEENTTPVGLVTATDVDAVAPLEYSIEGGADADKFDIDATTGALSFKSAPDYETPMDDGGDNIYDVIVGATDTFNFTTTQDVQVEVTDVEEGGGPLIIEGTDGFDRIIGTAEDEIIRPNAGPIDFVTGGGGSDTFEFGEELSNGRRESTYITDFDASNDTLDIGGDPNNVLTIGNRTFIFAGEDNDLIVLMGVDDFSW